MIKNDKQIFFNRVKGELTEIADGDEFSSITLKVGHVNTRQVNLCFKTAFKEGLIGQAQLGQIVEAQFYLTSHNRHERWYTTATLLALQQIISEPRQ
jgi:hypothetical protein